jgi:hypothetical protein
MEVLFAQNIVYKPPGDEKVAQLGAAKFFLR